MNIQGWRTVFAWIVILAVCEPSLALGSDLQITQFAHTAWGTLEGAPRRIEAIAQTPDGYLWLGSEDGLFRFDGVTFERIQAQTDPPLPADPPLSLLALPDGDLWIGFDSGRISLLRDGHAVNYGKRDGLPREAVFCLAQDQAGILWASSHEGLVRLENNRWGEIGRAWNFPGPAARALYIDRAGTLWVATDKSLVFLPKGAKRFQPTGIHVGLIPQIVEAPNGKLWMAETTRSVRPVPLYTDLAPPDNTEIRVGSQGILFARAGGLWITTLGDGLLRVPDPETLRGKPDEFSHSIERYTVQDGLTSDIVASIFQDRDGNIWVGTEAGLDRFRLNPSMDLRGGSEKVQIPPPSIQSIVGDGKTYLRWTDLKLPAETRNVEINYSAVTLTDPRSVHFRYRLAGVDSQWQDAGTRRTAYYTSLHPGKFTFDVMSGNEAGVWDPDAAVVNFTIPALWFDAAWFRIFCIVAFVLMLWTLYRLRLRQLERRLTLALGARLDERTRIARELHDTLLQSFHGLMFRFQAARNLLPQKTETAIRILDEAISATEQAIVEGRDAIRDLRPEPGDRRELAELLTASAQGFAEPQGVNGRAPDFRVIVEGKPRPLSPALQGEVYRIGREVILNAFRHALASRIEAEILYDQDQLRLRIRDDGKGISPADLEASGRPGHWGLPGIRERARRIGAQLKFWSESGAGTEVELIVPAAAAYEKQRGGRGFRLFRRGGTNGGRA
ncbi:MAG: two-component regulator propeller domain-containing protein [Acidobacteriaceae bacterium]